MRVAITHTRYTFKGGVERYVYDLVKRLLQAGHEVDYFCNFWDEHVDPRARIHKVPNPWKQIRFMKVWSFDRWLSRRVRRADFDIVHGFSKSSFQDIYTNGSGCLLDYQSFSIDQAGKRLLPKALRRRSLHQRQVLAIERRRFTRGNFSRVVTMSNLAGEQIKRRYGLTDEEVVTIYNGIDVDRFRPSRREEFNEEYRERLVVPKDCFVVLCVGNDYRRKGVPTLIEAARILKRKGLPGGRPFRFVIVGKERHAREKELCQLAKDKGVWNEVKFYGPQDLIERWHAAADFFVLPSLFDAFGNVVLEAMATGTPVLVSSKAGAAEVVQEGETGFVLESPEDAAGVAARVELLAGDRDRHARMGKAARRSAEGFSWDNHFAHMMKLYEQVAAAKKKALPA